MNVLKLGIASLIAGVLSGCMSVGHVTKEPPQQASVKALEDALESSASDQAISRPAPPPVPLLPPLQVEQLAKVEEERFDVAANQLSARVFFMGLVEGTPYNMVVHESITGDISLQLKDVTVAEVMKVVRDVYGYEYKRTGNLYQVVPSRLETQIYQVDYLDVDRSGSSQTTISAGAVTQAGTSNSGGSSDSNSSSDSSSESDSGGAVVGTEIKTRSRSNFWGDLQVTLSAIIGGDKGQQVVVTPQAGVIVVRAFPSEQQIVKEYLERAELTLRRQVVIEAKILEVNLKNGFQAGIDWTAIGEDGDLDFTYGLKGDRLTNPDGISGVFSAAFDINGFTALIDLLGTQGNVQVLSSPRVSTLNNQKAVIKVGSDEFYVTEIQNTTTTGTSTTSTPEVELTPFFSGIALDVTPQIGSDDEIVLHIHPSVSEVQDQQKLISVGSDEFNIPLAQSSIRESDSVVRARNGQIIVIGGLMTSASNDTEAQAPVLGDIPGIGALFQQRRQSSNKSELVILLRPVIADSDSWRNELQRSLDGFQGLKAR